MKEKFTKQNIKNEIQKLIKRLAEKRNLTKMICIDRQFEQIRQIRERNQLLRDSTIRRFYM